MSGFHSEDEIVYLYYDSISYLLLLSNVVRLHDSNVDIHDSLSYSDFRTISNKNYVSDKIQRVSSSEEEETTRSRRRKRRNMKRTGRRRRGGCEEEKKKKKDKDEMKNNIVVVS